MRILRSAVGVLGLAGFLVGLAGVLPASAAAPTRWQGPTQVTSGVPVAVSSITPCPQLPPSLSGDTAEVSINLLFPPGGASSKMLPVHSDGTWSGSVTFTFSGVSGKATMDAQCVAVSSTGTPYGPQYQTHHVRLLP